MRKTNRASFRRMSSIVVWFVVAGLCMALGAARMMGADSAEEMPVRPALITPETEAAIERGLAFLARTQSRDGSWQSSAGAYNGGYSCTMTSLAGLALMAAGNTPNQGRYALNVRRAVTYVLNCGGRGGVISSLEEEGRSMYGHGFGMLFLAQAYGMETDPVLQTRIRKVLHAGVVLTVRSQSDAGGWIYTPDSNGDEGSVTVTQIQALRACRNAGIKVPKKTIQRACEYIEKCANKDGGISYSLNSRGSSRPAITAAAVATLYNAGSYDNPVALRALGYLKNMLKGSTTSGVFGGHDYYSTLYLCQAMYLSSEQNWDGFFPRVRNELLKKQTKEGGWEGDGVGTTYGTAIALLSLQLPYAYLPILQR